MIGGYKRGDITFSVGVVAKIADALDVSVDYIIGNIKPVIVKNTLFPPYRIPGPLKNQRHCAFYLSPHSAFCRVISFLVDAQTGFEDGHKIF